MTIVFSVLLMVMAMAMAGVLLVVGLWTNMDTSVDFWGAIIMSTIFFTSDRK